MALQINNNLFIQSLDQACIGEDSQLLAKTVSDSLQALRPQADLQRKQLHTLPKDTKSLEERLYEAKAFCKIKTAEVAMYLPESWRSKFFLQLDSLMDIENWEEDDAPITEASFSTLLRMLLIIWPVKRPGLGSTSEGNIIAAWTVGRERLTIECLPKDKVRWVLSCYTEENIESAAGEVHLMRLLAVLSPYNPKRWFVDAT